MLIKHKEVQESKSIGQILEVRMYSTTKCKKMMICTHDSLYLNTKISYIIYSMDQQIRMIE